MELYDLLLAKKLGGGGGSSVTVEPLSVTQNGTYSETGKAYSPVNVSVPNPSTGTLNITENGTYDVTEKASAVVNVGGGGGLEYESGEITLPSNANTFEIPFQKSHSVPPAIFVVIEDYRSRPNADNMMALIYTNPKRLCDIEWWTSSSAKSGYGVVDYIYKTGSAYGNATNTELKTPDTDTADTDKTNSRYWVSETAIHVGQYSYIQWKSGNTIKWIAIWAPTS